MLKFQCNLLTQ